MRGNAERACDIITEHLPTLLITGSCYDKGRAQLLYSKCKIAASKTQTKEVNGKGKSYVEFGPQTTSNSWPNSDSIKWVMTTITRSYHLQSLEA